jgi:hypothetical protein
MPAQRAGPQDCFQYREFALVDLVLTGIGGYLETMEFELQAVVEIDPQTGLVRFAYRMDAAFAPAIDR